MVLHKGSTIKEGIELLTIVTHLEATFSRNNTCTSTHLVLRLLIQAPLKVNFCMLGMKDALSIFLFSYLPMQHIKESDNDPASEIP